MEKTSDSGGVWDGIVGVNGYVNLSKKWYCPYCLDIGRSQTDFNWKAFTGFGYRFRKLEGILGYRIIDRDFNDHTVLGDKNLSGASLAAANPELKLVLEGLKSYYQRDKRPFAHFVDGRNYR